MYSRLPSFVLGFHGCDRSVASGIISGKKAHLPSQNSYDWLGEGVYFWENNPQRAFEFAAQFQGKPRHGTRAITHPAVVGAVIDLGFCLNLLDAKFLQILKVGFQALKQTLNETGRPMPVNRPLRQGGELLLRDLDCAVINAVHTSRSEQKMPPFDTVRSAFIEGGELYEGSTFREKNHIQICVRSPKCIKGYFWPQADADEGISGQRRA